MAYIVGSASVEIVPDFRNAQNAITAWFAKQQNEIRVPIKPDMSPGAVRDMETQAAKTGDRVGKAIADATEKQMEAHRQRELRAQERLGEAMARDVAKSTAKAIADRARQQEKADADALAAQRRLGAAMARDYERNLGETERAIRDQAKLKQRLADEELRAQQRLGQQMAREVERAIAARARAEERAAADAARQRSINFSIEEREFQAQLRSQLAAMKAAIRDASAEEKIKLQFEIDKNQAILDARTTGGAIAQALNRELRQNAGIIIAGVTGALLAGGPLISAAATGMFVGVAAVGAFQSRVLRDSWLETFDDIRIAGISDTAVLVPAFQRMSATIGESFQRMRPQIREGLADAPILIDMFSQSLAQAAENAVPGLVRSVQNGQPIMRGFGDLMESLGQGTTDLLDNINAHAPAAGQSLSYLGDGFGELLPLLGELLGQGAELGTIVLPVLTSALGGTRTVIEALGGSLPILAAGFLAFRTVGASAGLVNRFSQSLLTAAPNIGVYTERLTGSANAGERAMTSTSRAASAVAGLGRALPVVGIAVGVLAAVMAQGSQQTADYAEALMKGGAAAASVRKEIEAVANNEDISTAWLPFTTSADEAADKVRELEQAMSPLELAQSRLAGWTEELAYRLSDESASAEDVAIAQRKVAEYTAKSAQEQAILERAVRGVTEAMAEQADQARARVDAEFGYQQATLDTQEAMAKYKSTIEDTESSAADVAQALLDVNTALRDQAQAAGDRAMARLPASMDDAQRAILGAKASLDELNGMIAMGIKLPPELETYRQQLIGITSEADGAKLAQAQLVASLGELGFAVSAIPNSKRVLIEAPTEELKARLDQLGFTIIELPNGDIEVVANTDEAEGKLGDLNADLVGLDNTVAEPTADLFIGPLTAEAEAARRNLANLDGQKPTPVANMNPAPFNGVFGGAIAKIRELAGQKPTPVANMNPAPFNGVFGNAIGRIRELAGQRPTPVAGMNAGPFNAGAAGVLSQTRVLGGQRPTPTVGLNDQASGGIRNILGGLNSIPANKTITITTRQVTNAVTNFLPSNFLNRRDGGEIPAISPIQGLAFGGAPQRASGATWGRGGPRDDLVPFYGSPGEHMLDAKDVALMGGQAGVYAFREMLNAGQYSGPGNDTSVQQMVTVSGGQSAGRQAAPSATPRSVTLYTPDVPAAIRGLKAVEHADSVLASPWP